MSGLCRRPQIEVAAALMAAHFEQCIALCGYINSGCNRLESERACDLHGCATHLECHLVRGRIDRLQCRHPGAIELQTPERRTRQAIDRPQAAPNLVDYELYAQAVQGLQQRRLAGDESLLCDTDLEAPCGHAVGERRFDIGEEIAVQD